MKTCFLHVFAASSNLKTILKTSWLSQPSIGINFAPTNHGIMTHEGQQCHPKTPRPKQIPSCIQLLHVFLDQLLRYSIISATWLEYKQHLQGVGALVSFWSKNPMINTFLRRGNCHACISPSCFSMKNALVWVQRKHKSQLMVNCWVWGPVVWIPGIPENESGIGNLGTPIRIPNHQGPKPTSQTIS